MTNQDQALALYRHLVTQGISRLEAINRAAERHGIRRLDLARLTAGDAKKTPCGVASNPQGLMGTA